MLEIQQMQIICAHMARFWYIKNMIYIYACIVFSHSWLKLDSLPWQVLLRSCWTTLGEKIDYIMEKDMFLIQITSFVLDSVDIIVLTMTLI